MARQLGIWLHLVLQVQEHAIKLVNTVAVCGGRLVYSAFSVCVWKPFRGKILWVTLLEELTYRYFLLILGKEYIEVS